MRISHLIQVSLLLLMMINCSFAQTAFAPTQLDTIVGNFLTNNSGSWRDMNIPTSDGKVLFEIIVKKGYTRALEIGTSTGHSAIWIAWALSKTGGRLTTIEIDEDRHKKAVDNFKKAGVDSLIDAQLADAHKLVPQLEGLYDFIFIDADKEWYSQYLKWIYPKLKPGGCFTAHNAGNSYLTGIPEFLKDLKSFTDLETSIVRSSGSGISDSYKVK